MGLTRTEIREGLMKQEDTNSTGRVRDFRNRPVRSVPPGQFRALEGPGGDEGEALQRLLESLDDLRQRVSVLHPAG